MSVLGALGVLARVPLKTSGCAFVAMPALCSIQSCSTQARAAFATDTTASSSHRVPSIHFPPRVLPDGRRISELPAAEAEIMLAQLLSKQKPSTSQQAPLAATTAAAAAAKPTAAAAPKAATGKAGGSATQGKAAFAAQLPPRRQLTQKEIDMINAGGAF